MKKNKKYLLLLVLAIMVIIAGLFLLNRNAASNAETREIDEFLAQVDIGNVNGWAIYPNCGDAGGRNDGYLLQVNNLTVSPGQASELKPLAVSRNYVIKERRDGYEIENNNWNIIVLDKNRADLFITIQYPEKPNGFPEGGGVCS